MTFILRPMGQKRKGPPKPGYFECVSCRKFCPAEQRARSHQSGYCKECARSNSAKNYYERKKRGKLR